MEGTVSVFPSRTRELLTTRSWDFLGFPRAAGGATLGRRRHRRHAGLRRVAGLPVLLRRGHEPAAGQMEGRLPELHMQQVRSTRHVSFFPGRLRILSS